MDTIPSEKNNFQIINTEGNEEHPLTDKIKDSSEKYYDLIEEKNTKRELLTSPLQQQILLIDNQQESLQIGNQVYPTLNKRSKFIQQKQSSSSVNIIKQSQNQNMLKSKIIGQRSSGSKALNNKMLQFKHAESIIQQQEDMSKSQILDDGDDEQNDGNQAHELMLSNFVQTLEKAIIGKFLIQKKQIKSSITFGTCIKVVKAVKTFKSYLLPKKIYQRQAAYINDASFFSFLSQNTNFHLKNLPQRLRQRKILDFFLQRNILFSKLKQYQINLQQVGERFFKYVDSKFPTIDPLDYWKILFDSTMIMITILSIFINTVEVSFDFSFNDHYPEVRNYIRPILIGFFCLSSFLNLNTKVSQKGIIEENRQKIFNYYVRNRFLQEILVIISLFTFDAFNKVVQYVIKLFILIQVKNKNILINIVLLIILAQKKQVSVVSKTLYNFQQVTHSYYKRRLHYIIKLIKLLLVVILVAHFVAIIFYGQILLQENYGYKKMPNWVNTSLVIKETDSWSSKYIFALYFSVTTMMTVGYGDITPKNKYEAVIVIVSMVIACGIFAYSFNLIGLIISEMNKRQKSFKKKMNNVNLYLSERNIDSELRQRVQNYLQYKYENDNSLSKEEEQQVLSDLSSGLIQSIIFQTKQNILNRDKKLFAQFSQEFKDYLCVKLKEIHINKDEVIFEQDTIQDDPAIYFIHKGSFEIYFQANQSIDGSDTITLAILDKGMQFGEMSFLLNTPRSASARALESSIVYSLSQSEFMKSLSCFTQEKEKYHYIIHRMMYSKSNQITSYQCYNCSSEQHYISQCPNLHYMPDAQLAILKNNFYKPVDERREFTRIGQKYNSFRNINNKYSIRKVIERKSIRRAIPPSKVDDSLLGNLESSYYNKIQQIQKKLSRFGKSNQNISISQNIQLIPFTKNNNLEQIKKEKKSDNEEPSSSSEQSDSSDLSSSLETSSISLSSLPQQQPSTEFLKIGEESKTKLDSKIEMIREQSNHSNQNKVNLLKETFISIPEENEDLQESQSLEKKNPHLHHHHPNQLQRQNERKDNLQIANNVRFQKIKHSKIQKEANNLILQYTKQIKQDIIKFQNSFDSNKEESPSIKKSNFFNRRGYFTMDQQIKQLEFINSPQSDKTQNEQVQNSYNKGKNNTVILRQNNKLNQKTLINLIQFKDQLQQLHQRLQLQSTINNNNNNQLQPPRKSLNKSNTAIPIHSKQHNEKSQTNLEVIEEKKSKTKIEEEELSLDTMKEYKYFYENYNYKNIISNYNKLKSIQNWKLPSYFAIYSFQNRKNKKLRAQALKFEFNTKDIN